ncbi:MAG: glycoside hydrolase [Planctomycetia bacterium]|nr:glycoside hydrolase [Planctomycetia bacterium]
MVSHLAVFLVLIFCGGGVGSRAEQLPEKIPLFTVGDDPAFRMYHIPGVVVTAKGTALAWCEARKHAAGVSDWDDIHILLRRSVDDGKTWSTPSSVASVEGNKTKHPLAARIKSVDPESVTYNNPVLIADRDGRVHMLFCLEYMRVFYQSSSDEGAHWTAPVEITAACEGFRKQYDWRVIATGPNHGIQLANGRLVVPVWLSTGEGGNAHHPSVTATIVSDDGGATWSAGDIAVPNTTEWVDPNEAAVAELSNGAVMLNVRSESKAHRRIVTVSPDGARHWTAPRFDDALLEPICMAGLTRYQHDGTSLLLFSNPDNLERAGGKAVPGQSRDRRNLTVKISYDDGKTWPAGRVLESGPSGYSDIGVTKSGTILCVYVAGPNIRLARFTLDWLERQ